MIANGKGNHQALQAQGSVCWYFSNYGVDSIPNLSELVSELVQVNLAALLYFHNSFGLGNLYDPIFWPKHSLLS
jgi:hypothetical protein